MPAPKMPTFSGLYFAMPLGRDWPDFHRIHVEEEGVDHVFGDRVNRQTRQIAAFNSQRGVEIDLRAFHHRGQCRFGGGVEAARGFFHHRRRDGQRHGDFRVGRRAAGDFVIFAVPRLGGDGVGGNPRQRGRAQSGSIGDQLVNQPQIQAFTRVEQFALQ